MEVYIVVLENKSEDTLIEVYDNLEKAVTRAHELERDYVSHEGLMRSVVGTEYNKYLDEESARVYIIKREVL